MKRLSMLLLVLLAFTALGSRYGYEERCKDLAAGIVQTWFEHGPVVREDIERQERFEELGCGGSFLEVERQRIILEGID